MWDSLPNAAWEQRHGYALEFFQQDKECRHMPSSHEYGHRDIEATWREVGGGGKLFLIIGMDWELIIGIKSGFRKLQN